MFIIDSLQLKATYNQKQRETFYYFIPEIDWASWRIIIIYREIYFALFLLAV